MQLKAEEKPIKSRRTSYYKFTPVYLQLTPLCDLVQKQLLSPSKGKGPCAAVRTAGR